MKTKEKQMLHTNMSVNDLGHLTFAGQDTTELARTYGTPLYLLDVDRVRMRCRTYKEVMHRCFGGESGPLYAGKALCFSGIYRIMSREGMRIDVVSCGELHTAIHGGFDPKNVFFHGNNKTDRDIEYAMDTGVGYFICDSREELDAIERTAKKKGKAQHILLRITPGIDAHTFAAVTTGKVDSKFGSAIATGQAEELVGYALSLPHIVTDGFHCHIGSQIFESKPFCDAADIMIRFLCSMQSRFGHSFGILNLGGGIGVRYTESDPSIDITEVMEQVSEHIKKICSDRGIPMPCILAEPGRSIVADAGMTLYEAGSVKSITGYKNYVSVDGGMTDNPRYALYRSRYTVLNAGRAADEPDFLCTVAGRCCESGDLIGEDILLAKPKRGDIIAVAVTGAYNYSMASNYNRLPRPALVMLEGGKSKLGIRRETFDDLTALDEQ